MASVDAITARSDSRFNSEDLASSKRQKAFEDLSDALITNDMTAAQEAVIQLVKLSPGIARSMVERSSRTLDETQPGSDALGALSDAVQNGDLKAAKSIFQEIQQNRKAPTVSGSNATQVLGVGVESVGAANVAPTAGTYLNTLA